jgi:hypothetical protein
MRIALLLSILAGCGFIAKNPPEGEGAGDAGGAGDRDGGSQEEAELCTGASGSRIVRLVRQHDDGSSEAVGLHDTEFDADCQFRTDGDGTVRCLPVQNNRPFGLAQPVFRDASCTDRVVQIPSSSNPIPVYGVIHSFGACSAQQSWFQLGGALSIPEGTTLYFMNAGVCTATTAGPSGRYYALGAELTSDRFVAATETQEGTGRLAVRVVEGEDGSRVCDREGPLLDGDLGGHPCSLEHAEDGVLRCLPQGISTTRVSSEEDCSPTEPAAQINDACGTVLTHTRELAMPGCASFWRVRELGSQLAGPVYLDDIDLGCYAGADYRFHVLGPVVAAESFVQISIVHGPGATRLRRLDLVADGLRVDRPYWYDSEYDLHCRFLATPDGASRCVPFAVGQERQATLVDVYTDPACEGASTRYALYDEPCGNGVTPKLAVASTVDGPRFYALGAAPAAGTYYHYTSSCQQVSSSGQLFAVGAEVPSSAFVAGTMTLER